MFQQIEQVAIRLKGKDREIAEKYRRAYSKHPQELWFAEASARIAGEHLSERSSPA